jgi:streptomycin 6-kinase
LGEPFPSQSRNYVVHATRDDGTKVVLKIGVPDPDIRREGEALRLFDGRAAVRLIDADFEIGSLLLEKAEPGRTLSEVPDDSAVISIAVNVMRRLWRPVPDETVLPRVNRWVRYLQAETQPAFQHLIDKARVVLPDLIQSSPSVVVLHGDLNPFNIVSSEREPWLAIDPKGEIGDPASEVGPWFYNFSKALLAQHSLKSIIDRRADQFADELGFDRARIRAWGFIDAVLSACWMIEDHEDGWQLPVSSAELLV